MGGTSDKIWDEWETWGDVPSGVVFDSFDMSSVESCMGDVAWEPVMICM